MNVVQEMDDLKATIAKTLESKGILAKLRVLFRSFISLCLALSSVLSSRPNSGNMCSKPLMLRHLFISCEKISLNVTGQIVSAQESGTPSASTSQVDIIFRGKRKKKKEKERKRKEKIEKLIRIHL